MNFEDYKFPSKYKGVHRVVVHYNKGDIRVMPRDEKNEDINLYPDLVDEIHFFLNKIGILKEEMFRGVYYYKNNRASFCGDAWNEELQEWKPFLS